MKKLENEFIREGGIRERMHRARTGYRNEQDSKLKQLEDKCKRLEESLSILQAESNKWKVAYYDLRERALKAYNRQQEEIATLKRRLKGEE